MSLRTIRTMALALAAILCSLTAAEAQVEHRLGGGFHYWRAIGDVASEGFDLDRSGLAPVLSYQLVPRGLLYFGLDLELFREGFGGATSTAFAPAVYVLVGRGFYGAVGVGVTVSSDFDGNLSDPFYAARVGLNLELLPRLYLDVNLNYRADAFGELQGVNTDSITAGALVRIGF
jgi:hypothetical protein